MPSVAEHCENLLAPVFAWMVGGTKAAYALGQADLAPAFLRGLLAGAGVHAVVGFAAAYAISEAFAAYHRAVGTPLIVGPFPAFTAGWLVTQVFRLVAGVLAGLAAARWGRAQSWAPAAILALLYLITTMPSGELKR